MSLNTPAEQQAHDAKIAEVSFQRARLQNTVDGMVLDRDSESGYRRSFYDEAEHAHAQAELDRLTDTVDALVVQYTGWPRYWHVTNANGHIHTSMSCSSCFPDTIFGWRTDLSGLTPEQVVEQEAHNACSVCMPIAPVEQRAARERYNAEQRDAKAAERQAKKDEKAAKALDRARKHALKVEKALYQLTGHADPKSAMEALDREWSNYGHDGRKSLYNATMNLPTQVGNTLSAIKARQDGERSSIYDLNEATVTALTERGLL